MSAFWRREADVEGHSQRVTNLSEALARKMGCSADELGALRRGAYLHDIGKMAIPDRVLLKPGALDLEERREIERHPEIARDIIAKIPFLQSRSAVPSHLRTLGRRRIPSGLKGLTSRSSHASSCMADQCGRARVDRPYRDGCR
jgi:putative nucleotidyltransferase with HDIG domain